MSFSLSGTDRQTGECVISEQVPVLRTVLRQKAVCEEPEERWSHGHTEAMWVSGQRKDWEGGLGPGLGQPGSGKYHGAPYLRLASSREEGGVTHGQQ